MAGSLASRRAITRTSVSVMLLMTALSVLSAKRTWALPAELVDLGLASGSGFAAGVSAAADALSGSLALPLPLFPLAAVRTLAEALSAFRLIDAARGACCSLRPMALMTFCANCSLLKGFAR